MKFEDKLSRIDYYVQSEVEKITNNNSDNNTLRILNTIHGLLRGQQLPEEK